jgi:16S rRNA U1498 N3-methylase RsmE
MNVTKLPRLLSAFSINQKSFKLQQSSVNHLKSLRLRVGSQFRVFDGSINGEFLATIHNPDSGECLLERKLRDAPLTEKKQVWLFTSALDRVRHSFLVEKAVELNVSFLFTHLVTDRTQHSNHKEDNDLQDGKFLQSPYQAVLDDTLQRYCLKAPRVRPPMSAINSWVRDATQQCERLTIPSVGKSLSLRSLLEFWDNDHQHFDSFNERCLLICDEDFARGDGKGGSTILSAIAGLLDVSHVGILIGPEGGFSETEKTLLKSMETQSNKRFKRVCLGPNILRVETAAIVALSQLSAYINAS